MTETAETVEKNQVPQEEPQICVVCGHQVGAPVELEEDEKKEYLRCILGNRLYSKEYLLYDGQVRMVFQCITQEESRYLNYVFRAQPRCQNMVSDQAERMVVKCLFYLREFGDDKYEVPRPGEELGTPEEEMEHLFNEFHRIHGQCSEGLCSIMIEVMIRFFNLTMQLSSSGLDATFYKGAGQA